MKLKKLLCSILCFAMVLGTMGTVALAKDIPQGPFVSEDSVQPMVLMSLEEPETWSGETDTTWYKDTTTEFVLTTAEQLAGLAKLVDEGNTFEGKTIKLDNDIDLNSKLYEPIGSYRHDKAFKGTFDGQEHSIKNLSQNTWELNTGYYYGDLGLGLFGLVEDAIIMNLTIDGAEISGESAICGTIAATAYGECTFENITILNANVADYQYYAGGIVGWASGNHKYIKCVVDASTTVGSQWGDFGNASGGIIGGTGSSATIYMKDCDVACRIDAVNDVVSAYQWYAYRNCGMLIGRTGHTATDEAVTNAAAPNLTCENVTVTYGDWANYTYCEFAGTGYPYVRVQSGTSVDAYSNVRYGHPTDANGKTVVDDNHVHNDGEDHQIIIAFDQLYGGPAEHRYCTYGVQSHDGVKVYYNNKVASVEDVEYFTLQDAVDATNGNGTVSLLRDVNESAIIKAPDVTTYSTEGVTIALNDFALNGNLVVEAGATATIKNGTIISEDSSVSAIQSLGTTTIENVDVTSARHAVRVEGGVTTINGGSYKVGTAGMTTHAVNVSDGGKVVINDGVFEGPAGVADSDSGAAVNVQADSAVKIYGGKFSGGKNNTLSAKETLVIYGGMFDQDPAAYIAETSEAVDMGAYEYPYGVAPKAAGKINVALEATDNKNVYNIVLTSADEYDINEFVSAELTFKNESTTVGGSVMDYKINGYADNKTFAQEAKDAIGLGENEEQYIISLNDGAERLSTDKENDVTKIIIGQVEFFGQGDIKFSVTKGEVDTTWQNTNLGRYYTTEIAAPAEATLGIDNATIDSNVPEVHRDVAFNVAFNHNIDTAKYWGNYQITATIKNSAMNYTETKDITIADIKSGACVFEDVPVGYITVTLKAPGFRTYTHNTTLEETEDNGVLVLNFWNDVKKGNDEAIEKGKDKMAHNFLVGDIVMDMKVDKYDLAAVTSYYGTYGIDKAEAEKYIKYDLNRDGDIDIRDVQYVLHTMGN